MPERPLVTVVYPLYAAASLAAALVARLVAQVHPGFPRQSEWLTAVFADDCSPDRTLETLRAALAAAGSPEHYKVLSTPVNLGLAANLNRVLHEVETPYVLTCHCDCLFASDDYVARALGVLQRHPGAAVVSGKPSLLPGRSLPFAEKLNLITNLMDILPEASTVEAIPVGFAEGRCDAFRSEAIAEVGFYDTLLRTSGEDQLLSAKLRARGWDILKAPQLTYYLLASSAQNTVGKLVRHLHMFARTSPLILRHDRSVEGLVSDSAGENRRRRALLRATQVAAVPCYLAVLAVPVSAWFIAPLAWLLLVRAWLYRRHLRSVELRLHELLGLLVLQPVLDFTYTLGFAQGSYYLWRRPASVR